jgi:hypothetical protein
MPLDLDRVTRRFHDRFKTERTVFLSFVKGIRAAADRQWYASLMLNRLMFTYFIQKKGLLDGDSNYLRHRLRQVQEHKGKHKVPTFYRHFLVRFFREGLSQPAAQRPRELDALLGRVPCMNGGLFGVHELEQANPDIRISDEAFEKLFDFFDAYQWHLDERPLRAANEINPDILGYIFEKYINQKQMGAYYTKEDITGYIARNTIIPFLFDAVAEKCPLESRPLRDDPDRYIYPAVRKGVDLPLPGVVAAGRAGWDAPAAPEHGLPAETWRDHVARRQRCHELRARLRAGEIRAINDLVTCNLDIRRFALDVIERCASPELLRAFYRAIVSVSVLDPTCGSGAFLFAALKVLEPLYDACLEQMKALVERQNENPDPEKLLDFRKVLEDAARHPNRRTFIVKSIIINNLYGVDIMEEAVEICKLRLCLRLVAQVDAAEDIEPLPDIDFNVRPGNLLVGFTRNEGKPKQGPRKSPASLRGELDRRLAREHGIDAASRPKAFAKWRRSHQPFHWFVEFPGILHKGGFDVIIGNPPYVSSSRVARQYSVRGLRTSSCPDIYACCVERSLALGNPLARHGMILPLSLGFSGAFACLRDILFSNCSRNWFSSYGRIPSALFNHDVRVRNIIHLGARGGPSHINYTTRLHRWFEVERPHLLESLQYARFSPEKWDLQVPKLEWDALGQALENCRSKGMARLKQLLGKHTPDSASLFFKKTAYNWLAFSRRPPPCQDLRGRAVPQTQLDALYVGNEELTAQLFALLNGKLAFLFWCILSDDFHVTKGVLGEIPAPLTDLPAGMRKALGRIAEELEHAMAASICFKANAGKRVGSYNLAKCRHITDKSDRIFARLFGLESVWEQVEVSYARAIKTDFAVDGHVRTNRASR